jgi:hypothetical protein
MLEISTIISRISLDNAWAAGLPDRHSITSLAKVLMNLAIVRRVSQKHLNNRFA